MGKLIISLFDERKWIPASGQEEELCDRRVSCPLSSNQRNMKARRAWRRTSSYLSYFCRLSEYFSTLLCCVRRSTFRSVATELTATRSSEASAVCLESSSCRPQIYSETSTEVELSMSLSCSRAVFYAAVHWDPVRGIATENSSKITECWISHGF